ncbi:uroporphyrinogen-III synthase [Cognatiluteimonas profundi]|uniref:uroporphyrinogen-III synthase n=1 Tax=Cognatiluteimonas profundi TaxID=2594501 RepID=UPI00131D1455|nr:uroporphyrinogen-III synthase [Lysobacter profundi]
MSRTALAGCYVISLRPVGDHAALRRAAATQGARVLALSPWKLLPRDDDATRRQLQAALDCERVLFTSPAAVRAAQALQGLSARPGQAWLAVGAGTAAALRRAGIDDAIAPRQMGSEGLLALPALRDVRDSRIGLVTAPAGREVIGPALEQRGAGVVRADVYTREPVALPARSIDLLRTMQAPAWLALSSGDALQQAMAALPAAVLRIFLRARVAAASERLATLARERGFADVLVAASASPRDLVACMASASMALPRLPVPT